MNHAPALATAIIALAPALLPAAHANPFASQPKADDVLYHIMPIAWRDGSALEPNDPRNYGDLVGVREGLPYLQDLGITAFWMNPVFPSPAYHGYQHGRADQINPWFGTEQDFLDLINAANALDIDLYIDFVVYGISHDSPWFDAAFGNPFSQFDAWLAFENFANTQYTGYTFNSWNGNFVGFTHWDLRNPLAADLVIDWSLKWLDPNNDGDPSDGIAGYRLDHVWVNYGNGPEGWGYNLDDFWADWHDALRTRNPDVFTFAEQHNWGSPGAEFLPQFNAAMTKPFEFAARDAVRDANAAPLYASMQQAVDAYAGHDAFDHPTTFVAIIGDHDVDRLASAINATSPSTIDRAKSAAAVLLLQPFPPIIYYGDEIAMTGTKQSYFSDADDIPMREPFKWNATNNTAPMSDYHLDSSNPAVVVNQFSRNNDGRSVEEQTGTDSVLETYRTLIQTRHDNVALRRGTYHAIDADSDAVWAFLRRYEQSEADIPDPTQSLVALVNLAPVEVSTTVDLADLIGNNTAIPANDIASPARALPDITSINAAAYPVTIPAHGYALIEADLQRPPQPPFAVNGTLEDAYTLVASSPTGGDIYAAFHNDTLYVATQPAANDRDRFILVAENPGPLVPAPWAKDGLMAQPDAYAGNESSNAWSGWFDAAAPAGTAAANWFEVALDLDAEFNDPAPDAVHIAVASFLTADADPLDPSLQVPAGNADLVIDANEYIRVELADIIPTQTACTADADNDNTVGPNDLFTVLANFGSTTTNGPADGDVFPANNPDGAVGPDDLFLLLAHFGQTCSETPQFNINR